MGISLREFVTRKKCKYSFPLVAVHSRALFSFLIQSRIKAILDANRNSLMLLDLKFSIGTLGLATGTLFAGLYGMNLKNFIEESDFGFGGVSVTCFAITAIVCVYGLAKLRKVQRVRMWGEAGVGGPNSPYASRPGAPVGPRANWRADSVEPLLSGIPGEGRAERLRRFKHGAAAATVESSAIDAAAEKASTMQESSDKMSANDVSEETKASASASASDRQKEPAASASRS